MKIDILAIGVHPDDVELSATGTLLKHIAQGKKVGLLDLTRGQLGTRGTPETRDEEAANSARIMGAAFRKNLNMEDGFFRHDMEHVLRIIPLLREHRPEIVLANALEDRHPDHGRAARLVADACFYSGLVKIPSKNQAGENQKPWRPKALYHYLQDKYLKPDFVVDITDYIEKKMECILAFKTQFHNPDTEVQEPATPISTPQFLEFLKARNRELGRPIQVDYAEGFQASRTIGVSSLFDLE